MARSVLNHSKRTVYLNEFNFLMENIAYLPFVSGLLYAYAKTSSEIMTNYEFAPFLFYRDTPERVLKKYNHPSVAAFSVYMWNEQLNLCVAEEVKRRYPDCLIIFGGPQVPFNPADYFKQYPFIDITVRGEGEETFSDVLLRAIDSEDFSEIPGIAWRDRHTGRCVINSKERIPPVDLDKYPSPYAEGLYEYLFSNNSRLIFQAVIETNRGCPFNCSYCFWGKGGLNKKFRFHSLKRVRSEIEWCATHKIRYIFNADSNFGIHERDYEVASFIVEIKKRYGYPEKFRTCFSKNTNDRIFRIGLLMQKNELVKGVTISRQSNSEEVMKNIGRQNIDLLTFNKFQLRFNKEDIPVYSELIVGLPGESYESFVKGIEEHLESGLKNQVFVYLCEVYPNTKLAEAEYRERFGIRTKRILFTEIHGSPKKENEVQEFKDIIVGTSTMSLPQWREAVKFSWMVMLLHSMKLGFFILKYLNERYRIPYTDIIRYICEYRMPSSTDSIFQRELGYFESELDNLLQGGGQGHLLDEYGSIYWDTEEASFLRISERLDQFYNEFLSLLRHFLTERCISYSEEELVEAVAYQRMKIPSHSTIVEAEKTFSFNFPEYFESCLTSTPVALSRKSQILTLQTVDYKSDKKRYAREVIVWGRKSGTMLVESSWRDNWRTNAVISNFFLQK